MKLIKNLFIDLNNVGENYAAYERILPDIVKELRSHFKREYSINEEVFDLNYEVLRNITQKSPYHHYPAFWHHLLQKVRNKRFTSYEEIDELYKVYLNSYEKYIKVYPDFLKLVKSESTNYLTKGIIANGNSQRIYCFLHKFNLVSNFETIVTSGSNPFKKPNDSIFSLALFNVDALPHESIFIGDRLDTDIEGANKSGIWSIHLKRKELKESTPKNNYQKPDFVISSLDEVENLPILKAQKKLESALILTGGKGIRMGDLTATQQKCLLSIDENTSVLEKLVKNLVEWGVKNFHFICSYRHQDVIDCFSNYESKDIKFEFHIVNQPSTGQAVFSILDKLPENFIYSHGNILFKRNLFSQTIKQFYKNKLHSTFSVTSNQIAPTHPIFEYENNQLCGVLRHPNGKPSDSFRYSIGFSIISKKDIIVKGELEKVTTEQLFFNSLSNVNTFQYDEQWFHLEKKEDLEHFKTLKPILL